MKRTALIRRTPLARTSRLPARRATPRRSERVRDVAYMLRVKGLQCAADLLLGDGARCSGAVEADHAGIRPAGRKADDNSCIGLCLAHHRARHDFAGVFRGWSREQMRRWLDAVIAWTRKQLNHTAGESGIEAR